MTTPTVKSMNLHFERPDTMISVKIPAKMKRIIKDSADALNMNVSQYIKLAIVERLEKDLNDKL